MEVRLGKLLRAKRQEDPFMKVKALDEMKVASMTLIREQVGVRTS